MLLIVLYNTILTLHTHTHMGQLIMCKIFPFLIGTLNSPSGKTAASKTNICIVEVPTESKLSTSNIRLCCPKPIITHSAPLSVVVDL